MKSSELLRNIAIIAHVDHGKTTLVDGLLRQSGTFRDNQQIPERVMDRDAQERERGITILAKNTAIRWGEYRINIVDTPGHADFGGEVERILRLVDSTLLLVDAAEGPMPQTRFVLRKSLELGHRPIVVINKIDRSDARPDEVLNEVFDLFVSLDATDAQLDFPVAYASSREGYAMRDLADPRDNLRPLVDLIVQHTPAPPDNAAEPLQLQVATLDYDEFLGRIAIGRVYRGCVERGQRAVLVKRDGSVQPFRVTKLMGFLGLERIDLRRASTGDILALAGVEDVTVGETICAEDAIEPRPMIPVDEPTVSMFFMVNTSPFGGQEGRFVTSRHLRNRLLRQAEHDVSLRVEETEHPDILKVSGRGTLHLSVLIENMRREGYELAVSQPRVITKTIQGVLCEPYEEVVIECDGQYQGSVIDKLNQRGGELQDLLNTGRGTVRIRSIVPSRGLIGYRSEFLTDTHGTGVVYAVFDHFGPHRGAMRRRPNGVLIAQDRGETVVYGLHGLQERGYLCCGAGESVYGGQIVGVHSKPNDIVVNPCRKKQLTNMRAAGSDEALHLVPPRRFSLEAGLEFLEDDELLEVTPKSLRLRKRVLDHIERKRASRAGSQGGEGD